MCVLCVCVYVCVLFVRCLYNACACVCVCVLCVGPHKCFYCSTRSCTYYTCLKCHIMYVSRICIVRRNKYIRALKIHNSNILCIRLYSVGYRAVYTEDETRRRMYLLKYITYVYSYLTVFVSLRRTSRFIYCII